MTDEQRQENKKTNTKILKIFMWLFLGFVALVIVGSVIKSIFETPEQKAASIKHQAKLDSIQVANEQVETKNKTQEKELREAYIIAKLTLKKNLKDPDSYDEIEDKRFYVNDDKKIYIQVIIKYRAKNSFGAMNIGEQAFNFDKSMNMIESYEVK